MGRAVVIQKFLQQRSAQSIHPSEEILSAPASAISSKLIQTVKDEVQVAQAALQATCKDEEIPYSRFILSSEYFPVTKRQMKQLVTYVLTYHCSERTSVIVFSDAGAARGGYSQERYELTPEFLSQLKQRVRYIAWLNPMPRSRWAGTTAGEIARLVPMFEFSRQDLQNTISFLRGRSTNFSG